MALSLLCRRKGKNYTSSSPDQVAKRYSVRLSFRSTHCTKILGESYVIKKVTGPKNRRENVYLKLRKSILYKHEVDKTVNEN